MPDLLLPGQPLPLPTFTPSSNATATANTANAGSAPGSLAPTAGPGTYMRNGVLRSSLVGAPSGAAVLPARPAPPVPRPGSVVLGLITRLTPQAATLSFLTLDGQALPALSPASTSASASPFLFSPPGASTAAADGFTGTIPRGNVRQTEKDKVKLSECFRPGDVVRARVLGLGDARGWLCGTERAEEGVVFATSEAGATMHPLSWQTMRCSRTGLVERRKVAKPEP
ncbi:hypothetical protein CALCODRAFT_443008 [Calocera cornea HHB12733]|uniref:Exosome complex component CSL4 C-terminal domain-containing protein n=1 Tax=Calocera cornea HHB12733 TaxID=1353952 RepID=A0A165CVT2_9BASI|nr:hypothetical protein CALCODRAFT_443008 [Calocera cornea HHB12733]